MTRAGVNGPSEPDGLKVPNHFKPAVDMDEVVEAAKLFVLAQESGFAAPEIRNRYLFLRDLVWSRVPVEDVE